MFAITSAVLKWRQYLLGRKFFIHTDQRSLKSLTEQTIQTPEQQQFLVKLLGFQFEIVYKPGKENTAADGLSRIPTTFLGFFALSGVNFSFIDQLRQKNTSDVELQGIHQGLLADPTAYPDFTVRDSLLYFRNRLMVPTSSSLCPLLITEFHSTPRGGHSGVQRTFLQLSACFFWRGMRKQVQQFVDAVLHLLRQNLLKSQIKMKVQSDKHRLDSQFNWTSTTTSYSVARLTTRGQYMGRCSPSFISICPWGLWKFGVYMH
ncbi:hypothetical protein NE237_026230 [Protea cynaroides]|uniref:Reverse transcriptase RNase H-like domain-containing protein n=1 Tax=Protea cynaroides TaxID=273540 RepID=A0A9Q0K0A7_9MAGN|nr:hypothetical protein NE237_026230 [Protea cynaroides]